MRPRHYAAENPWWDPQSSPTRPCFNEAAALRRGKPGHLATRTAEFHGFNEAAALRRGKPFFGTRERPYRKTASMRPRHYAAENQESAGWTGKRWDASMRPRHYAAENPTKS